MVEACDARFPYNLLDSQTQEDINSLATQTEELKVDLALMEVKDDAVEAANAAAFGYTFDLE